MLLYNNPEKYEIDMNMFKVIIFNPRDQNSNQLIYQILVRL